MDKALVEIRWEYIEGKSRDFFFDFDALLAYFLKLGILERLADFDKDAIPDLLIHAGPPLDHLYAARGKGDGLFYRPVRVASDLNIDERTDIQIVDVNGDKFPDIVAGIQRSSKILWFRNQGECKFDAGRTLISEPGFNRFVVCDVDADNVNDVALTMTKKGMLKIVNGRKLINRIRSSSE